jgi:hypothetical protein
VENSTQNRWQRVLKWGAILFLFVAAAQTHRVSQSICGLPVLEYYGKLAKELDAQDQSERALLVVLGFIFTFPLAWVCWAVPREFWSNALLLNSLFWGAMGAWLMWQVGGRIWRKLKHFHAATPRRVRVVTYVAAVCLSVPIYLGIQGVSLNILFSNIDFVPEPDHKTPIQQMLLTTAGGILMLNYLLAVALGIGCIVWVWRWFARRRRT